MRKSPLAFKQFSLEVIVWVGNLIAWRSPTSRYTTFSDDSLRMMGFTTGRLEPGAHSWRQVGTALICVQDGMSLQDIDEFLLLGVGMAKGGDRMRCESR